MRRVARRLALRTEEIRILRSPELVRARGGVPDTTTAATDGNTDCPSEATGCHTAFSGCGSC